MIISSLWHLCVFLLLGPTCMGWATEIVISFDDFPMASSLLYSDKQRVQVYVDKLAELNVQAVFFCIGQQLDSTAGIECLNILSQTHLIANHSYHHQHLSSQTMVDFTEELFAAAGLMEERKNYRPWFRFPYLDYGDRSYLGGSDRKRTAAFLTLRQFGYQHGYVTINTFDWQVDHLLKQALKLGQTIHWENLRAAYMALLEEWMDDYHSSWCSVLKRPFVHVLLLHQNDLNALFLSDIVKMIRNKEWEIVHPDKAFCAPIPYLSKFANTKIRLFQTKGTLTKEHVDQTLARYCVFSEKV